MEQISAAFGLDLVVKNGTHWVRSNNVLAWAKVEPSEGTRDWASQAALEQELKSAASQGLQVILIIRQTPVWAQLHNGHSCSPVSETKIPAFADFLRDAVARYSASPYNIRYWEIWNEPDVDYRLVSPDSDYGCWGNPDNPYYGGGYYAQVLKAIYPQIKAADPQAQVLIGGLMLGCDPINPPQGADCKPSKFLEGILKNGGGSYFDGVSFHAYDYYWNALGVYINPNWSSSWDSTGPVVIAKSRYLRQLLSQYGFPGKFIFNTEAAIICGSTGQEPACRTPEFESTKASYLVQLYASALAEGLPASLWYNIPGWRASGLINLNDKSPLPAFKAYQFIVQELRGVRYRRTVQDYPGLRIYEFEREGQRIWILWSLDGITHTLSISSSPQFVFDVFGSVMPMSNSLTVGGMPVYFEWRQ
jgi:hypothetical protein